MVCKEHDQQQQSNNTTSEQAYHSSNQPEVVGKHDFHNDADRKTAQPRYGVNDAEEDTNDNGNYQVDFTRHPQYKKIGAVNLISLFYTAFGIVSTIYLFATMDETFNREQLDKYFLLLGIDNYYLLLGIGSICGYSVIHSLKVVVIAWYNILLKKGKISLGLLIDLQSIMKEVPVASIFRHGKVGLLLFALIVSLSSAVPLCISIVQSTLEVYEITSFRIIENVRLWEIGGCDLYGCHFQSISLLKTLNEVENPDDFLDAKVDILSHNSDTVKLNVFTPMWDDTSVETVKGRSTFSKTKARIMRGYGLSAKVTAWWSDNRTDRIISPLVPLPNVSSSVSMSAAIKMPDHKKGVIAFDLMVGYDDKFHSISIDMELECVTADYELTATVGKIKVDDLKNVGHLPCKWDSTAEKVMDQLNAPFQIVVWTKISPLVISEEDRSKNLAIVAARYTSVILHRMSSGDAGISKPPANTRVERLEVSEAIKFSYMMPRIALVVTVINFIATIVSFFVPTILSTDLEQNMAVFDGRGLFFGKCAPAHYVAQYPMPIELRDRITNRSTKMRLNIIREEGRDKNNKPTYCDSLVVECASSPIPQRLTSNAYLAGKLPPRTNINQLQCMNTH